MGKGTERHCNEPIIQEPETPPYEDLGAQRPIIQEPETPPHEDLGAQRPIIQEPETPPHEDLGAQSDEEFEQEYEDGDDDHIEDEMIDLRPTQQTENGATGYKIRDGHEILDRFEFDPRVPDDQIPYLLIIRSLLDEYNVTATILIPCRTANEGVFPLDGTYYQNNEVFVDHSSSRSPIKIKRESIDIYSQCTVYFGTSIHSVTKDQTLQGIHQFYHKGYICNREFDRSTRRSKVLSAQIHATNGKGTGRKRSMTSYVVEARSAGEGNDKDGVQSS
ncbi:DNA glycosylase/AP lyase ROS1 [Setaria viridis]|uniref:DNA glycosylase/AP lyase ROS1 n=1 Tax=Setaria viridis TaxID=4556 RepID=UPI003B3ABC98